jgi:formylglycine-generating enzyme required for sulfatase activity
MIWIPGEDLYISETEITNEQFKKFVDATGYRTVAERKPTWNDLKESLPPGTEQIPDSLLVAGSLVFQKPDAPVTLNDFTEWWIFVEGADWLHPEGPNSNLEGRWDHPVVHIAYQDALAYCEWNGSRLPTEAEWESASQGSAHQDAAGKFTANTFQGSFPLYNLNEDGFESTSPVKTFSPGRYGIYDMIGNVWEWTADVYRDHYSSYVEMRVSKGGSYLCAPNYCSNYYTTGRQGSPVDSGTSNLGFRVVKD